MSGIEHFKGKLTPTGQDLETYMAIYMEDKELPSYYDDVEELFHDELSTDVKLIDGQVYKVEREYFEDSDSIFKSSENEDGTIDFEVKYYNGGCGFSEALDYALEPEK